MSQNLTVLKLGGALLTDKKRPFTLRRKILHQTAAEIKTCLAASLIEQLILVHGVGSFGHPPVVQHRLHKGYQSPDQLIHLTFAQNSVLKLRLALAEALHQAGIAAATILPSSCMAAAGSVLESSYLQPLAGFLALGMVPLIGGDVLVDRQIGFTVYGGDQLAVDLALHFDAARLIFATEVDGIFDRDPHRHKDARRYAQFSISQNARLDGRLDKELLADATGAMAGKLTAVQRACPALAGGLQIHIISMTRPGSLQTLLQGSAPVGTQIIP